VRLQLALLGIIVDLADDLATDLVSHTLTCCLPK
jgi:hypothetical protein